MKANKGFTIIEVLVVIAIIAILTILIFPSLNNIKKKNRDAERIADISSIQLGLALYYSKMANGYPTNLKVLLDGGYITSDTMTDPDGNNYTYVPLKKGSTKCTYYHLGVELDLPSAQIDANDFFNSTPDGLLENGYSYCGDNTTGLAPDPTQNYNVHP